MSPPDSWKSRLENRIKEYQVKTSDKEKNK